MLENRFPRIWVPDAENRDLRQLLWHRHRLVQMRTRVMNQLHVVPLNEGLRRKKALWRPAGRKELEAIALAPWASRRRQDLLDLLDQLTPKIEELTRALEQEVEKRRRIEVNLVRWIDPAKWGWYSGDTHIHAGGCAHYVHPTEGVSPET